MPLRDAVRGLTVIVGEPSPERLRTALALAAANAALGGRARLFLEGEAGALLHPPIRAAADDRHAQAGLPTLAALFEEALGLGVEAIACQSGVHLTAIDIAALDPRVTFGGLVGVMQALGDDRLVIA